MIDLASREFGASVVAANDEFFGERQNLIKPESPTFAAHTYGPRGQIVDGWETRRRREPGHDYAVVRLGCPGVIQQIVIDTSHFTGNYPPEASVEACGLDGYPSSDELLDAEWTAVVPRTKLAADSAQEFEIEDPHRFTHVRLSIYPDGGVARLRVLGEPVVDPGLLLQTFDLAAAENGAGILDCSNKFYSSPGNLLKPGPARSMGDGWETARRRDDDNDWVVVQLACAGRVSIAEIDTTHFIGNAPAWATLTSGTRTLLPQTALQPDTRHRFRVASAEVDTVRLDISPDGGVARLRLFGAPTDHGRAKLALRFMNSLPEIQLAGQLAACCSARSWVSAMSARHPYRDVDTLLQASDTATLDLDPAGFAEALAGHPRIGERRETGPSASEQAGMHGAGDDIRARIARANAEYERRFDHVYLVRATGRSADELLAICESRLANDEQTERAVVLRELAEINRIRLRKLLNLQDLP